VFGVPSPARDLELDVKVVAPRTLSPFSSRPSALDSCIRRLALAQLPARLLVSDLAKTPHCSRFPLAVPGDPEPPLLVQILFSLVPKWRRRLSGARPPRTLRSLSTLLSSQKLD